MRSCTAGRSGLAISMEQNLQFPLAACYAAGMAQIVLDAANLKKAMRHLAKVDPDFARVLKEVGHPALREVPTGFGGLMRSIVGQQVSVHAARSIWLRLEAALPAMEPADFLALNDEALRAVGLDRKSTRLNSSHLGSSYAGLRV